MDWHKHLEDVAILNRRIHSLEIENAQLRATHPATVKPDHSEQALDMVKAEQSLEVVAFPMRPALFELECHDGGSFYTTGPHPAHRTIETYYTADQVHAALVQKDAEIARLKHQVQTAFEIVNRGIALMSHEQLGQWEGVGSFMHQETDDYYTDSELIATLRDQLAEAEKVVAAAKNLAKVKGRFHTEQAFRQLVAALSSQQEKGEPA